MKGLIKSIKKVLAVVIAVVMVMGVIPVQAAAAATLPSKISVITPFSGPIPIGGYVQFVATVYPDDASQEVTWTVTGYAGAGVSISAAGLLTVATNVPLDTQLHVTATSTVNTSVSLSVGPWTVMAPAPPPNSITVTPATANVESGGSLQFSAEVFPVDAGQGLIWEVTGHAGVSIDNGLLTVATNVPNGTVLTVTAKSEANPSIYGTATVTVAVPPTFQVTVIGSYHPNSGAGRYAAGEEVTIRSGIRYGHEFTHWTSEPIILHNYRFTDQGVTTTFTMPAQDVTVTANWTPIPPPTFQLTIIGSSIQFDRIYRRYAEGVLTSLWAETRPGYRFTGWTSTPYVPISNFLPFTQANFIMPAHDVTVTANWTPIPPPPPTLAEVTPVIPAPALPGQLSDLLTTQPVVTIGGGRVGGRITEPQTEQHWLGSVMIVRLDDPRNDDDVFRLIFDEMTDKEHVLFRLDMFCLQIPLTPGDSRPSPEVGTGPLIVSSASIAINESTVNLMSENDATVILMLTHETSNPREVAVFLAFLTPENVQEMYDWSGGETFEINFGVSGEDDMFDWMYMSVTSGDEVMSGFDNPVIISVNTGVLELDNPYRLTAVDSLGNILGGVYSPELGLFTFPKDTPGFFRVEYREDLINPQTGRSTQPAMALPWEEENEGTTPPRDDEDE